MATFLDSADIQGNVLRAYGAEGFPKSRTFFVHFNQGSGGRAFVEALRPVVTTAARWAEDARVVDPAGRPKMKNLSAAAGKADYPGKVAQEKPAVAINIAFSFWGLQRLGVPIRTLRGMPDEFIDGMANRASVLGDPVPGSSADKRDAIWCANTDGAGLVHAMVSFNAQIDPATGMVLPELDARTQWLVDLCPRFDVVMLPGNGPDKALWQDGSALISASKGKYSATRKEHFGFSDGFGDPVFEGQYRGETVDLRVPGHGKIGTSQKWEPLATGEFLLGHVDEAQEIPGAAMPIEFSRNGTFLAWRKLHENVATFKTHIAKQAEKLAKINAIADPQEARDTLMAKLAGRWPDGVPLETFPTQAERLAFNAEYAAAVEAGDKNRIGQLTAKYYDFRFGGDALDATVPGDLEGTRCPVGAHVRRANPRDMLDPYIDLADRTKRIGSSLVNRRRILRRGLPYGSCNPDAPDDASEHGIIFMALCSSLFRQFEFVQQQWINYGLDFNAGNDTCPMIGNHNIEGTLAKHVIPDGDGKPPFIVAPLPQFVECRGGEYFFIPSMTALRMIGMGIIDPT